MAGARRQDLLGRLADLSEEAIQRLGEAPGADRMLGTLTTMRDRVDELQRRVRGIEALEKRLAALERKVDRLQKSGGASSGPARRSSSGGRAASKSTAKKS
ncbi:MAG TPA: hypothetical protein VJ986_10790 [Gaiellaceae bacterium]|nr:hypothetical protein [Gaiellaceae bacterium]